MLKSIRLPVLAAVSLLCINPVFANEDFFGSGVPLEMAVKKIVPAGTTVVLADGVDKSASSNWGGDGDGSWKKAVASAASSAGYVAVVTDQKVTITTAGKVVETKTTSSAKVDPDAGNVVAAVETETKVRPRAERAERAERPERRERAEAPRPARRNAERAHRQEPREPRVSRRERVVTQETVSGGGFVFVPEEAKTTRVARVESSDAKGRPEGWQRYERNKEPRVQPQRPVDSGWVVNSGDDLYAVLSGWAARDGWTLNWQSDHIYGLTSSAKFQGSFEEAVTQLLAAMRDVRPVVTAKFHEANKTIVIGNDLSDSVN